MKAMHSNAKYSRIVRSVATSIEPKQKPTIGVPRAPLVVQCRMKPRYRNKNQFCR